MARVMFILGEKQTPNDSQHIESEDKQSDDKQNYAMLLLSAFRPLGLEN